ncbi:hypothetical protein ECE50_005815 [Chitinophaga sp. Mgbs1]|uniref:Uncharacterized protein n=1 Tax=Chitinophaga solisilvae TaxID=1233460 RepID=A0A9Q5D1H5_9BACT|nr:hypothetical protein [Chitinophaga solisilvae]
MRIIHILLCLLCWGHVAAATEKDLARTLSVLTSRQQAILYQYATLQRYSSVAVADSFWQQYRAELPPVSREDAGTLAQELLANTEIRYRAKQPSRLQALRGVFTASRLLIGLSGLIAAWALLQLLGRYWTNIRNWLIRHLAPLFYRLFSPRMLTWELLLLGLAAVYTGVWIQDTALRTVVIHCGLFVVWAQLTAIATRRYLVKQYLDAVMECLDGRVPPAAAFREICLPAAAAAGCMAWVIYRCQDEWYAYEIAVPLLIALFAMPPVTWRQGLLSRLLLPFGGNIRASGRRLATYTAAALAAWGVLICFAAVFPQPLATVGILVAAMLLYLSVEEVTRCGRRNYIWLQLVTVIWCCAMLLAGTRFSIPLMAWTALGALLCYVLIKYWEIPVLLGYSWKRRKAWGMLGMALIIWGIASLIRWQPQWFIWF